MSTTIPPGTPDLNDDGVVDEKDVAILMSRLGTAWWLVLLGGLSAVALGIMALVWPGATLVVVGAVFGAWLLVSGVVQVVQSFRSDAHGGARVLLAISGVLSVVLGIMAVRSIFTSLAFLGIFIGVGWLFRGVAEVIAAIQSPGMQGRVLAILLGALSVVAGLVLLIWPVSSVATLVWVTGIMLVVVGIAQVFVAFRVRSEARRLVASHTRAA